MANELKDWSELGEDLLGRIGQRLIALDDVIRSRAVCNPWRRALRAEQLRRFSPSSHWLMLPWCNNMNMTTPISSSSSPNGDMPMVVPGTGCQGSESCRCFYDVVLHQFHHIEFPRHLRSKTCRGSATGWLCMVGKTPDISLFNPLTKTEIPLPPITSFPDVTSYDPEKLGLEYLLRDNDGFKVSEGKKSMEKNYIIRVAVSAEPTTKECIVMAMRCNGDHRLAFCRPAEIEAKWMFVPHMEEDGIPARIAYADVVFWRGQFYALDFQGNVLVCDFSDNPHRPTLSYFLPPRLHSCAENWYLVVSPAGDDDDELMMVTRHASSVPDQEVIIDPADADADADADDEDEDVHINVPDSDSDDERGVRVGAVATKPYWTEKFQVFKLNKSEWDEVESIGDFALFLGFNTPGAFVSTKDYPGLKPNSIYFTDDIIEFHYHPQWKHQGHFDMGIYDLATHAIQPLYSTNSLHNNPLSISPLPMWLSPS